MIPIPPTVYIAAGIFVAGLASGYYAKDVLSDRAYAQLEAAYANERTISALAHAAAEAKSRETEQNWVLTVNRATEQAAIDSQASTVRIRALAATNDKLSERIAALTAASRAAENPSTAVADLLQYIERAGPLVVELDDFARQAAESADTLRDELALCRAYIKALQ